MEKRKSNCNEGYLSIKQASKKWRIPRRAVRLLIDRKNRDNNDPKDKKKGKYIEDAEKPEREDLFSVGYEYPENCFTFFSVFKRTFRSNKNKTILIITLVLLSLAFFAYDYYTGKGDNRFLILLINLLLSMILIIYFFISDSFDSKINSVSDAFPQENYKEQCEKYYGWARCLLRKKTKEKLEFYNGEGSVRKKSFGMVASWVVFCIIWLTVVFTTIIFVAQNTSMFSCVSGYCAISLYVILMVLLSQSYYNCIVFICFFQLVSGFPNKGKLLEYDYNKDMPSQSTGLLHLLDITNDNAGIFLSISSILGLAFLMVIRLSVVSNASNTSNSGDQSTFFERLISLMKINGSESIFSNKILLALIISFSIFAIISTIVVNYGPKMMLRRILKTWVDKERNDLQKKMFDDRKELDELEESKDNKEKKEALISDIDRISSKIKLLKEERIELNDDYLKLTLTVLNLIVPIASFIATIWLGK